LEPRTYNHLLSPGLPFEGLNVLCGDGHAEWRNRLTGYVHISWVYAQF
jgi:hypothetical protein